MAETSPDVAFTVKVDGRTFVLDRITLGDWRMFKTEFGLKADDIVVSVPDGEGGTAEIFNVTDPNVLVAFMVASLQHERPHTPLSVLIAEVDDLTLDGLEFPNPAEDEDKPDPQKGDGGGKEATGARKKSGSSEKRQKKPGRQS